jgi:putative glutamine amidotransferase
MMRIASWIREKDEPWFGRSFAPHADVELVNGRRGEIGPSLEGIDALLLTGGEDIAAEYLRQPVPDPSPILDAVPERDSWEFAAFATALARRLPILGVCKGHQVLNVGLGGTLQLDIPGHDLPVQKDANIQPLRHDPAAPSSRRFAAVNSSHHQAIDVLGEGLVVEAWHAGDGTIEQVRSTLLPWCVGVQYHPERDEPYYASLFADFVAAARR